jgi:hypothetical protein
MPAPVYTLVWYDTEDYVHPDSDDAALRIAELHSRHGVAATFKVVGEKARVLRDRGRQDVIEALRRHDIGYHTDLHSAHPTTTEYCEPLRFEHGEALFRKLESQGLHDVQTIFQKDCSTFGQAGGSWAPQQYPVLRQWGIPTYVDDGVWIGLDNKPFWYMGLLHVFRLRGSTCRFTPSKAGDELDGTVRYDAAVRRLGEDEGGVVSVFFHPCEWSTDRFWDGVNFAKGTNPDEQAVLADTTGRRPEVRMGYRFELPPTPTRAEMARRFEALDTYLGHIAASQTRTITCADLPRLFPDRALGSFVTREWVVEATADWFDSVDYAAVEHGWLSAAELLTAVVELLSPGQGQAPAGARHVARPFYVDGPVADAPPLASVQRVPFEDLLAGAAMLREQCFGPTPAPAVVALESSTPPPAPASAPSRPPRLPSGVRLGQRVVRPEEFLMAAVRALRTAVSTGQPPADVDIGPTTLAPAANVPSGPGHFRWACFADDFDAPNTLAHARRQCWTLKPASYAPEA